MDKDFDKIRRLFEENLPALSDDEVFMSKIRKEIYLADMIMASNRATRKRTKYSAVISGICGFVCGVILTYLLPYISVMFEDLLFRFIKTAGELELISMVFTYITIAIISIGVSVLSYGLISSQLLKTKTIEQFLKE